MLSLRTVARKHFVDAEASMSLGCQWSGTENITRAI